MNERFDWKANFKNKKHTFNNTSGLEQISEIVRFRKRRLVLQGIIIMDGLHFAVLSFLFPMEWVQKSPLFNVMGAGTFLFFLCLTWLGGIIWWSITNSHAVRLWAEHLLPFGHPTFKPLLGIVAVFILLSFAIHNLKAEKRSHQKILRNLYWTLFPISSSLTIMFIFLIVSILTHA